MSEVEGPAAEIEAFVDANWALDLTLREWWERLAVAGLAFPTWPEGLGGRGWSSGQAREVGAALAAAGVVGPPAGVGQNLGGPTLVAHGTPRQQKALVPRLASGAEGWCQLFSEPGAGSDLAGLQTKAVRDGDEWIVNGQKVWNSSAHIADRGLLLARTDSSVPKHEGISYFVIDMDQPGVEARPLVQMNGEAEFCEVFLTDARIPADRLIGGLGEGWKVTQTTLAVERAGVASSGTRGLVTGVPGRLGGMLDRTVGEVLDRAARSRRRAISGFVINNRSFRQLGEATGRNRDPIVRQQLAAFRTSTDINRYSGLRARASAVAGNRPGPESSTGKLAMSDIAKASRDLAFTLLGADGMLADEDAPAGGAYHRVALASFGAGMGGGTDEIQRNVIGERALGLPKEPQVDRGVPFDQLRVGTQRRDDERVDP
jgi:alkylation response protein AidB-like acyl-CoA dehydrogenase